VVGGGISKKGDGPVSGGRNVPSRRAIHHAGGFATEKRLVVGATNSIRQNGDSLRGAIPGRWVNVPGKFHSEIEGNVIPPADTNG